MAEGGEGDEPKKKGDEVEVPASSSSAWTSFLIAVDDVPPKSSIIEGVSTWLTARGISEPSMLEGVSESALFALFGREVLDGLEVEVVVEVQVIQVLQRKKTFKASNRSVS